MNKYTPINIFILLNAAFFIFSCSPPKKTVQAPVYEKPPVVTEVKPVAPAIPEPPKQLNFSLLLPLDLKKQFIVDTASLAETSIDGNSLNHLHFLEGAMLAVDSLKQKGIIINLKTHDTAIDSFSLSNLFYKNDVLTSDCIFAAFNSAFYTSAASLALKHNNKIVFTLPAPAAAIKKNKNVFLSVPTTATQCILTAEYILKNYESANKIVLNREVKREKDLSEIFMSKLSSAGVMHFTWSSTKEDSLLKCFSQTTQNVMVVTSSDEAFISPLLNKINALNMANITIIGLPTWENFESIDFSSLKNLNILYFSSTYLDIQSTKVLNFRKIFLNKYNTEPLASAFQGFDLINYFARQMIGEKKSSEISVSLLPFQFLSDTPENGFENKSISILQVKDYTLTKKN